MKPPSRRRVEPSRFRPKRPEEDQTGIGTRSVFCKGWTRREQRSFLQALKRQKNYEAEIDPHELHKKVPMRSLQEIEDLIKHLRSRVLQMVFLQVQSQRREERKNKVPIEMWGELVQKLTGSHDKTISSAFSQMLVVAATEPCSLVNSIPPQDTGLPTSTYSNHSVAILPKPPAQLYPSAPVVTALPTQIGSATLPTFSLIHPSSSSNKNQPDKGSRSVPQEPSTPTTSTQQMKTNPSPFKIEPEAVVSSLSAMSIDSASPSLPMPCSDNPAQSEGNPNAKHRPRVLKCIVNFEKIYQYLSDPDSRTSSSPLTSMESAVVLDMLMSLPEELPLLDCNQIQQHLLNAYKQLSKPAQNPTTSPETCENSSPANVTDSADLKKQETTKPKSSSPTEEPAGVSSVPEPVKDKDWDAVGMRPLNPLLIPIDLLKRLSVNDTSGQA